MPPNTLNMVDISKVPLPFSPLLILPHVADVGPIGIEILLCHLNALFKGKEAASPASEIRRLIKAVVDAGLIWGVFFCEDEAW
jgi:hypothetical protein